MVLVEDVLDGQDEAEDDDWAEDDDGDAAPSMAGRTASPSPAPQIPLRPSCGPSPRLTSSLSPHAAPFLPRGSSVGRSKACRWADTDPDDSDAEGPPTVSPTTYLDAVLHGLHPARMSPWPSRDRSTPAVAHGATVVVGAHLTGQRHRRSSGASGGHGAPTRLAARVPAHHHRLGPPSTGCDGDMVIGTGDARRGGARRRRRHRRRGLPTHPVHAGWVASSAADRVPVHQRLGPRVPSGQRRRFSAPGADGWREVMPHVMEAGRSSQRPAVVQSPSRRPSRRVPEALRGKCFNCLSSSHRVATCRLPPRCLRCRCFRHIARDCKRRRSVEIADTVGGRTVASSPRVKKAGLGMPTVGHQGHLQHGGSPSSSFTPRQDSPGNPMSGECGVVTMPVSLTVAVQGDEVLTRVVHLEPVLAVDRCLEAPCRDFDPMLDEVEVTVTPGPMTSAVYGGEVSPSSTDFAPRRSPLGKKQPRMPQPDSEVTELELLRRSRGSSFDDDGHNTQPPSTEASLLAELEEQLCIPLETPLLSKPRLRRSRTPSMVMSVCRSGRLAAKTKASNPTVQAQNVLKQKLGIADMPQGPDPVAMDSIKAFFAEPWSPSKQEALQALFAPDFDSVAMELDLTGFEHDAF